MPKKVLPHIAAVGPGDKPLTLLVVWENGDTSQIDVSGMVESFKVYAPLRQSPELFGKVQVGEYGTDVVWTDEIDMSADTLWRLAQEQSGETITADEFRRWRKRKAYTFDTAALSLGISRRTVAYYESGHLPIPRLVALATRGLDAPEVDDDSKELTQLNAALGQRIVLRANVTTAPVAASATYSAYSQFYVKAAEVASLFTAVSGAWHSMDEALKAGKAVRIGDIVKSRKEASLFKLMSEGKVVHESDLTDVGLTPIELLGQVSAR